MKRALTIGMIATVAALATALVVSAIAVANAQAATFTATDTADLSDTHPGDGVCNSSAGTCTLRAAIEESNALGGTNTVQLLPGGAYDVNTWANPVVCEGTYPWILCNCEGSVAYPGLDITSHVNITVAGSRTGGPTFAPGNPRTSEPTPATIAITARPSFNDPFSLDCYTTWSTFRIEAAANVTFNDLIIRGGCACFDHFGGAIKNAGALTLTNTTLASNTASSGGGAIYSTGTTLISRSSIGGGNNAPLGGGLLIGGGTTTIAFSTVSGNTASSAGGGIENGGTLVLKQSTVAGNAAASGGGVDDTGSVTMTNTTISSNSASSGGGGIRVSQGRVTANNATIAFNVANSDADTTGHGGGIDDSAGGTVSLANTIVADNVDRSSSSRSPDCVGTMTSLGYDLLKTVAGCTTTGSTIGDVLDKDPQLGPLQKNGGSTPTHALLVNVKWRGKRPILVATPPLDAGSPGGATACAPTDQRGVRRPIGKRCDIGAYEYVPPTAPN